MSSPRKPHAYELALRSLQSLEPNFTCGICLNTLEDTHVMSGCLHRFCGKCIALRNHLKNRSACPTCGSFVPGKHHARDPNFDQVIKVTLDAVNYLQEYDASVKEQEQTALDAAYSLINIKIPRESSSSSRSHHDDVSDGTASASDDTTATSKVDGTAVSEEYVKKDAGAPQDVVEKRKSSLTLALVKEEIRQPAPGHGKFPTAMKMSKSSSNAADFSPRSPMADEVTMGCSSLQRKVVKRRAPIKTFEDRIKDLKDFKQQHGHCDVPRRNSSLSAWCSQVRLRYKQQKIGKINKGKDFLSPELIKTLDSIGFEWKKNKAFEEYIKELAKFKDTQGHCDVPNDHPSLGHWIRTMKRNYRQLRKGEPQSSGMNLTPEMVKLMEDIGFRWLNKKKTFEQRLEELAEFKRSYGHCRVPYKHPSLGVWCHNVKQSHKRVMEGKSQQCGMRLTPERIKLLEGIDFFD